jgi:hypothetical protein
MNRSRNGLPSIGRIKKQREPDGTEWKNTEKFRTGQKKVG